jgi:hypothetical protein
MTMKETFQKIVNALSDLGDMTTWSVVLAIAITSTISMAIVQLIKELTPLRLWYNRKWIAAWIDGRAAENATKAKKDIVELATGGLEKALYDLPTEELTTQMNEAAQITLDDSKRYQVLLAILACGLAPEDLTVLGVGQPSDGDTQAYFDARNRAVRRIQRNLDGVRLALGNQWKFFMQILSVGLTVLAVEIAVGYKHGADLFLILLALPIGIVGGYFAPVARDVLAILQRLRDP